MALVQEAFCNSMKGRDEGKSHGCITTRISLFTGSLADSVQTCLAFL